MRREDIDHRREGYIEGNRGEGGGERGEEKDEEGGG